MSDKMAISLTKLRSRLKKIKLESIVQVKTILLICFYELSFFYIFKN